MTTLDRIIAGLSYQPKDVPTLAFDLKMAASFVETALRQLTRGGYVAAAEPGAKHCGPGCNSCSMTSMCSNSQTEQPKELSPLWRLTAKGQGRLPKREGFTPLSVR
jgi:hypothetical protein